MSAAEPLPLPPMTYEEYCLWEAEQEEKHDFDGTKPVSMAGGSLNHSRICVNLSRELSQRLKGSPCEVLDANFRIAFPRKTYTHYADSTVVCGPPQIDPRDRSGQCMTNPTAIVEVLSPSTEGFDRGTKFDRYRELESFREYAIVFQDRPEVQTFFRQSDGTWLLQTFVGLEVEFAFRSIPVSLPMREIYDRIRFDPPSDDDTA